MHFHQEPLTSFTGPIDKKEDGPSLSTVETPVATESNVDIISDTILFALDDALNFARLAAKSLSQDEFSRCFEPKDVRDISTLSGSFKALLPTAILTLCYVCGIFIRYFILFPMRLGFLLSSTVVFGCFLPFVVTINNPALTRLFFLVLSKCWAFSISVFLRHHGEKPNLLGKTPHIFVSNHTSFIDFILLSSHKIPHATVAQTHGGLFGIVQQYILSVIGSLSFQRNEKKDRTWLTKKLQDHVKDVTNAAPILMFPEGTCVNNDYTVLFHKGAFELGVDVCPVAIKYNKKLVDPYWNTKEQTFTYHALYLMTRWMVVADVWWLPPQCIKDGENAINFANRVKGMISSVAGLKNLSWDGYLKNFMAAKDQSKLRQKTQKTYGSSLAYRIGKSRQSPDNSPLLTGGAISTSPPPTDMMHLDNDEENSFKNGGYLLKNSESMEDDLAKENPKWLSFDLLVDVKNKLLKTSTALGDTPTQLSSGSILDKMQKAKNDITRIWRSISLPFPPMSSLLKGD